MFIKAFTGKNGKRIYYFTSVTVSKDGREVVVSNQEKTANRIAKLIEQNKLVWLNNSVLHPTSQVEESVPLNDSHKPTQTDNQPAVLGINSSEISSTDKGTTKNPNDQEKNIENAETAQTLAGKVAGAVSKIVEAGSENELQKMNMTTLFKGNAAAAEDMQAPRVFVVTNPK